jgi:hypothetical protein
MLEFEAQPDVRWQPLRQVEIAPHVRKLYEATMQEAPVEVWQNDTYEVIVKRLDMEESASGDHLSIKRFDRAPIRNWRHFQQIKNEICGDEREAVELFPRESRIVDNANQYHLWVLPEGAEIPIGFSEGMVVRDPELVEEYNRMTPKGRQEPMQEGLTTGEAMNAEAERTGVNRQALDMLRNAGRQSGAFDVGG